MTGIIKDLLSNLFIMIAALTFGNLILRDKLPHGSKKNKYIYSLLYGGLGCLLIIYGENLSPSIVIDYRCIPILLMGIYSSFTATAATALIIGAFSYVYTGFNETAVTAAFAMAILCSILGKLKIHVIVKWIISFLCVSIVTGYYYNLAINDIEILKTILPAYYIGLLIITVVTYKIKTYNIKINEIYSTIKRDSNVDYLTGLYNNRYFDKSLHTSIADAKKKKQSLSLLFIDIDFFKKVNDTYGHLNGDKVIKEVGEILHRSSRKNDIVSRKGGEEFIVLLSNCDLNEATHMADRIRSKIEMHTFKSIENMPIKVTVSIGISSFPETTEYADNLTVEADIALYKAKCAGRNMCRCNVLDLI